MRIRFWRWFSWRRTAGHLSGTALILALLLAACGSDSPNADPAPTHTPPAAEANAPSGLTVAWVDAGNLYTWREADPLPRRIASGGVIRPFVSPDGRWVAYLRGPEGDTRSLWISDTPGANERQLVDSQRLDGNRIVQVVWGKSADRLYFNTLSGTGINTREVDDLWRVDAATGTLERLLSPGEGGRIFLSPDGARLVLVAPGRYQDTPGTIAFYTLDTRERRVALEFPAVATASERGWYAQPRWLPDGTAAVVAIPPVDLVYGGDDLVTTLWRLPVAGPAATIATLDADFFGLPTFAPDGQWITYFQRRPSPAETTVQLMLARADGSDPVVYASGTIGTLTPPEWLPTGDRFTYHDGSLWLGQPGVVAGRFPTEDSDARDIVWGNGDRFVIVTAADQGLALHYGQRGTPVQPLAESTSYPLVDAVAN